MPRSHKFPLMLGLVVAAMMLPAQAAFAQGDATAADDPIARTPDAEALREAAHVYFAQGDWEIDFAGGYNWVHFDDGDDTDWVDFLQLQGRAAYFVIDGLSVGADALVFYLPEYEATEGFVIAVVVAVEYHFQFHESIIPYVTVAGGLGYGSFEVDGDDDSETLWVWSVGAGAKVPLNEHVFVDFVVRYTRVHGDFTGDGDDIGLVQMLVGLGITF